MNDPAMPGLLKAAGIDALRYPGGSFSDIYNWQTNLAQGGFVAPNTSFANFMTTASATGANPIIDVNYGTGTPALAAAWVQNADVTNNFGINYWEVGNETWNPGYMGSDPGRTVQAQDFVTFCQTMKQADPTILCGITANSQADWETILSIAAADVGFMSVHSYEAWKFADYSSYLNGAITAPGVNDAWNALQKYPAHKDRIKLAMTETGGITYGVSGTWTQADTGHALMTFDLLAQLQQDSRLLFTQFWNTRWIEQNKAGNVWPNYPSSEYDTLKPDNTFTPQGMAINLLADYSLARMVGTTSTLKVRVFASHDPATGRLNLWLVNKSTSSTTTTVTLKNYTSPTTGAVSVLKGTSTTDQNPSFTAKSAVTVTANTITTTLDPASITVIRL